jgi:hypothetical protein
MVEYFRNDRLVSREVHRVQQSVPQCNGTSH